MKHMAAYALLVLGGNAKPSAAEVEKLMSVSGVKADKEAIERMIKAFDGKELHELVAEGMEKMASLTVAPAPVVNNNQVVAQVVDAPAVVANEPVGLGDIFGLDSDEDEY